MGVESTYFALELDLLVVAVGDVPLGQPGLAPILRGLDVLMFFLGGMASRVQCDSLAILYEYEREHVGQMTGGRLFSFLLVVQNNWCLREAGRRLDVKVELRRFFRAA